MNRRRFLQTSLAGTLAAPLGAGCQEAGKVRVIALVFSTSPVSEMVGTEPVHPLVRSFVHGLRDLGWVQGRNLTIEARSALGDPERYPAIFAELVARKVEVIVTSGGGNRAVRDAQRATRTIPIVFYGPRDPVESGLVASLARPGANTTGMAGHPGHDVVSKRIAELKEIAPRITRIAWLGLQIFPDRAVSDAQTRGLTLVLAKVDNVDQYAQAFAAVLRERADALYVDDTGHNYVHAGRIAAFAAQHRLPTIYGERESVEAGGLASYGTDLSASFRRLAAFVDRILKGVHPGDIPIERPTKFELVINLRTAKTLGITIPQSVLLRADRVIE
jgi:putative ABC transport system substrate-binding protein